MKKPIRKGIALGLSLSLLLGICPRVSEPYKVQADEGAGTVEEAPIKDVNMGTNALKEGNVVYFGIGKGNPDQPFRMWNVLSLENDRALLHAYSSWGNGAYSTDNSNAWETSYPRELCNTWYTGDSRFNSIQKEAIMEVTLPAVESYTAQWGDSPVASNCVDSETTEHLFILSAKELETYCGTDKNKVNKWWHDSYGYVFRGYWTRSAVEGTTDKVVISDSGPSNKRLNTSIRSANSTWSWGGWIIPAFYLDLSKVLLTEANGMNGTFAVMSKSTATSWYLTLKATDENMGASLAGDKNYFISGESVTVNHTPAAQVFSGANQTSGLLVNENNEVIAYGKIGDTTAESSTFQIPSSGIVDGKYKLYVFAEQENKDDNSGYGYNNDYASDLGTPIPIEIHTHQWDTVWEDDDDYHWHDCTVADCPVTDNSQKSGYAAHKWGTPIVTKEATCTEDGTQEYNCTVCNHVKTETISAKGHSFGAWQVTARADCVNDGTKQRVCTTCGYTETETIPALGHNWESSPTIDKPATCTEAGSQSVHCTRCAAVKGETTIPATGHSYGAWQEVNSPDCINQGSQKRICSVCGHTETQNLDPLGHNWENSTTVDKAPTCTEAGSQSVHCTRCDAVNESRVIPALGHDYGAWQEMTAPTCTTRGSRERTCQRCNHVEQQDIAALGHDWEGNTTVDKAPTCTEEGSQSVHCNRCSTVKDSKKIQALGHDFGAWQEIIAPTCIAVGSQKHTCQRCSLEQTRQIPALGHSFGAWTVTQEPDCTDEGEKERVCQVCSIPETEKIPAKGHDWGEWEMTVEPTCTTPGEEKHVCDACGIEETRELPSEHDWEEEYTIEKEPTCTEPGEKSIHCKKCEEVKDRTEIPAEGHKWDKGKVTKEPTYTEEGERTYTCTVCGIEKTEPIPMLMRTGGSGEGEENGNGNGNVESKGNELVNTGETDTAKTVMVERVKTGDDTPIWTWVSVLVIAVIVIAGVLGQKREKKK